VAVLTLAYRLPRGNCGLSPSPVRFTADSRGCEVAKQERCPSIQMRVCAVVREGFESFHTAQGQRSATADFKLFQETLRCCIFVVVGSLDRVYIFSRLQFKVLRGSKIDPPKNRHIH
jgi:hypothetical protein